MMSVYGKRCLRLGCTGRVTFEVGPDASVREVVVQWIVSVLGYAAVQSAQILRLFVRRGSCVEMFAGSRARRLVLLPWCDPLQY